MSWSHKKSDGNKIKKQLTKVTGKKNATRNNLALKHMITSAETKIIDMPSVVIPVTCTKLNNQCRKHTFISCLQ
jgi:hypothetical protein